MGLSDLTPDTQAAVAKLLRFAQSKLGVTPQVTSTVRTCAEQDALFAKGRTTPGGIVTNARGCISWHVLRRAVDISLGPGAGVEPYRILGEFWESLGGFWGGRIQGLDDFGHFEWHPGVDIEELCPVPTACSAAVNNSLALHLAPLGESRNRNDILVATLVAAGVFGLWYLLDTKRLSWSLS